MKVILTQDTKKGKINQVIEVPDGYGANYLIPKGLAVLYNAENKHILEQKLLHLKAQRKSQLESLNILKTQLEAMELIFSLKVSGDIVHHSITRKQIHQSLLNNKINLKPTQIENVKINTLGVSNVKIFLDKDILAQLKIKVLKDDR